MIGERLKILRKQKRLSQKELAGFIDSSQGYICDIEQGKKMPGSEFLLSLKRFFGISLDWFLTGEGEMRGSQAVVIADPATDYRAKRKHESKLEAMFRRVVEEGDQKKIKAVEAQLDLLDPGEKIQQQPPEQSFGSHISDAARKEAAAILDERIEKQRQRALGAGKLSKKDLERLTGT